MKPQALEPDTPVRIELTLHSLLLVVYVSGGIWLLTQIWPIVLIVLGALILVGTLNPFATFLQQHGFSRTLAVVAVFLALLTTLSVVLLLVVPPLITQAWEMIQAAPETQTRIAGELASHRMLRALAEPVRHFDPLDLLTKNGDRVIAWSRASAFVVGIAGTILTMAFYILVDSERSQQLLFVMIPRAHHVKTAVILARLETIVGGYMRGQVITSAGMALFVFCLLWLCGVPSPLPIAVFAGITDVLPFVGGLLGLTPAVLSALSIGPGVALVVFFAIFLYQEFESRILLPRIYGKALHLPPIAIVIALLVGGWLLGIIGALIALPVAAGLVMLADELRLAMPGLADDKSAGKELDAEATRVYEQRSAQASPSEAPAIAAAVANEVAVDLGAATVLMPADSLVPAAGGHDRPRRRRKARHVVPRH